MTGDRKLERMPNPEPAEYMRSVRGGCKLVRGGFVYRIKHRISGTEYYACDIGCSATVVVVHGFVRSTRGRHDHEPETGKIQAMQPWPYRPLVRSAAPAALGLHGPPGADTGTAATAGSNTIKAEYDFVLDLEERLSH